jgi:hypothetical protein
MLRSGLCGCKNWTVTENEEYRENKVRAFFLNSGRWTQQYAGHNCMTRHVMCRDTYLHVSRMISEGHERWYHATWRGRIRLELILNKYCIRIWTSSFYLRYGSVGGFFENGNEHEGFIKVRRLSNCLVSQVLYFVICCHLMLRMSWMLQYRCHTMCN